jgi:hypothetical protein
MQMQRIRVGFVICLALCTVSCSRPKAAGKLYGAYEADYDVARERVTLNSDSTFVQEVTLKNTGTIDAIKGTWKYDPSDG